MSAYWATILGMYSGCRVYDAIFCPSLFSLHLLISVSCTSGASISIGWRYREQRGLIVDDYEAKKGPPRKSDQLVLNRDMRENILLGLGYSQKDIANATRINVRDKNKRRQTIQNLSTSNVEERMENAAHNVKRMFGFGRR